MTENQELWRKAIYYGALVRIIELTGLKDPAKIKELQHIINTNHDFLINFDLSVEAAGKPKQEVIDQIKKIEANAESSD